MCIRFQEKSVRALGRTAMGVIGMNLDEDDEIVGMQIDTQGDSLLFASEYGMGKRTALSEFKVQNRGGKGVKCYNVTDKTGRRHHYSDQGMRFQEHRKDHLRRQDDEPR